MQDPAEIFRLEARELLEQVEQDLLDLAERHDDLDLVNAVFRGLHTLKGSGAMFGMEALAAFTHHCETAFDRVRKGLAPATSELINAVLNARDHMRWKAAARRPRRRRPRPGRGRCASRCLPTPWPTGRTR